MDDDFMKTPAALSHLGLEDYDELERIVVEYGIEADFDEDGMITGIEDGPDLKEALFEEHRRKLGYRPDDVSIGQQNLAKMEQEAKARRVFRKSRRAALERRVSVRRQHGIVPDVPSE